MTYILFQLNEKLYVRDPQKTLVGQAIVSESIKLIDRIGFEDFTFRKIAEEVQSTEATIYRYFENKFRLFQYLVHWYWTVLNFQIDFHLNNISDPEEKLRVCLQLLARARKSPEVSSIDLDALHRIVVAEFDKAYLSRTVDDDDKEGLLDPFKDTCKVIAAIAIEVNPKYPFPHSLISTAVSAASRQLYFSRHLPVLSDIRNDPKTMNEKLYRFLEGFVFTTLKSAA